MLFILKNPDFINLANRFKTNAKNTIRNILSDKFNIRKVKFYRSV